MVGRCTFAPDTVTLFSTSLQVVEVVLLLLWYFCVPGYVRFLGGLEDRITGFYIEYIYVIYYITSAVINRIKWDQNQQVTVHLLAQCI